MPLLALVETGLDDLLRHVTGAPAPARWRACRSVLDNVHSLCRFLPATIVSLAVVVILAVDLVVGKPRNARAAALTLLGARGAAVGDARHRRARRPRALLRPHGARSAAPTSSTLLLPGRRDALVAVAAVARRRRRSAPTATAPPSCYALVLTTTLGMMLMAAATDLLMAFLSLEMVSIMSYVLAGFRRRSRAVGRGRAQVRHLRRRRLGRHALRHVAPLRPGRLDQLHRRPPRLRRPRRRRRRCCWR